MNSFNILLTIFLITFLAYSCSLFSPKIDRKIANIFEADESIYDHKYDPGPIPNSTWANLINSTPGHNTYKNAFKGSRYSIAKERTAPVWYRGRLKKESVKVLIIGSDHDQKQFVANRAFIGETGLDVQNFLKYLGITKSYLFLNVIPYEQKTLKKYTKRNIDTNYSSIIKHRHRVFNYAIEQNKKSLSLIITVGKLGEVAVKKWLHSFGEEYNPIANEVFLGQNYIKGINVVSIKSLRDKKTFSKKREQIITLVKKNDDFFIIDNTPANFDKKFIVNSEIAIPPKDLSFGSQRRIQNIKSKNIYKHKIRFKKISYDSGPHKFWGVLKNYADVNIKLKSIYSDNFDQLFPKGLITNGLYRGDLYNPVIIIISDQFSKKDLVTARALTGPVGLDLQIFLKDLGIYSSYVVINSIPFYYKDINPDNQMFIAKNIVVSRARDMIINQLLSQKKTKLIFTLGDISHEIAKDSSFQNTPIVNLVLSKNGIHTSNAKEKSLIYRNLTPDMKEDFPDKVALPEEHFPF